MRLVIGLLMFFVVGLCDYTSAQTTTVSTSSLTLSWVPPVARENGNALIVSEIGGYEVRYRLVGTNAFNVVVVPGGASKSVTLSGLIGGEYDCQIAAFDTDGSYSNFVAINYKLNVSNPKPVSNVTARKPRIEVVEGCAASSTCKVLRADSQ